MPNTLKRMPCGVRDCASHRAGRAMPPLFPPPALLFPRWQIYSVFRALSLQLRGCSQGAIHPHAPRCLGFSFQLSAFRLWRISVPVTGRTLENWKSSGWDAKTCWGRQPADRRRKKSSHLTSVHSSVSQLPQEQGSARCGLPKVILCG